MSAGHEHSHSAVSFNAAFAVGIALNMGFVLIEGFYGLKVNSLALLADAGHNLSDVAGLVLAWGGMLAGRLRPNARHTYGWKRASILAAFVNALLLLVAMGSLVWEALHRLKSPEPIEGVTIMVVAGIGIVVNTATALLFMRGRESDLNIRGAFLHMAADALVSAGVVVAGGLALWFGWAWLDPVVSLAIAAVIVVGTWSLFKQSLHLLFDGVPDGVDRVRCGHCDDQRRVVWRELVRGRRDHHQLARERRTREAESLRRSVGEASRRELRAQRSATQRREVDTRYRIVAVRSRAAEA